MANFVYKMNRAGIVAVALKSPEVRKMIAEKAEKVANKARSGGHTITTMHAGISRARSYVFLDEPGSATKEAKDRILGRAIGGG